jgi:PAS domain S-box-containing protein
MQAPAIPEHEVERLQALRASALLDTPPEERFDRLTRLAKRIFGTRIALVSLVDTDRQWFKSRQGLEVPETSRTLSFCGHAILGPEILEVRDASKDSRFSDNPLVTGEPRIRFYAGAPVRSADGYPLGTLCIIDDRPRTLTEDERLSLRELADCVEDELSTIDRRRLSSVARQTTNGVVITDLDGRIEWVNEGFTRLTGYGFDEVRGQSPGSILQGVDTNPKTIVQMRAALAERSPFEVEVLNYDKRGRSYWVHISCNPLLDGRGRPEGFMAIESDITEIKQAERMKRELTATVSHELRTPLTSIAGAIGLLNGGAAGPLPEAARNLVAIADKNAQRLRVLIDDLLDMEKLLAGKLPFAFQDLELRPLLEQALSEHQPFADTHDVRLTLADHADHARVHTDPGRFQQVLSNLLSNAVKFSPQGGEVAVTAHPVDQAIRVEVRDRGPGIDPRFHPQIFQKFAQADASDTRRRGGTGLGLAITRELVEQMHGRIGFDSTPGDGATFWFELPAPPPDSNSEPRATPSGTGQEAPVSGIARTRET